MKRKKSFSDATRLIGKRIAIFMDDQFIETPVVQDHHGWKCNNNDQRDNFEEAVSEAKDLADTIRSGALPFRLMRNMSILSIRCSGEARWKSRRMHS